MWAAAPVGARGACGPARHFSAYWASALQAAQWRGSGPGGCSSVRSSLHHSQRKVTGRGARVGSTAAYITHVTQYCVESGYG